MTPPSMESIFLILSGVILAAGVLYWFWSHIQLTQKKVQLLENAVFELRGMLTGRSDPPPVAAATPAPSSDGEGEGEKAPVYNDLADDDWDLSPSPQQVASTPLEHLDQADSDLQPGGGAGVGVTAAAEEETDNAQFRELFIQHERMATPPKPVTDAPVATSLEAMPVKELRRLAEQRGITGVSELKKKELLSALRQQITSVPPSSPEKKEDVVVERTLDLTEVVEEVSADAIPE